MVVHTKERSRSEIRQKIDTVQLSERLTRRKPAFFNSTITVTAARALRMKESWEQTQEQPADVRAARAIETFLTRLPIAIQQGDLTVGNETEHVRGTGVDVEFCPEHMLELLRASEFTVGSPANRAEVSSDDREALKETCLYFLDKSQERLIKQVQQSAVGDWFDIIHENRGLFPFETIQGANLQPDWGMLLSKGLRGIIDEIQARLRRFSDLLEDDPQKMWFWQAAIITCEATIHFAHRYARLASDLAAGEKDPQRRTELERIADICMHVPEHPARTFHEALQSIRIFTVACQLEHNMRTSAMPGRVDQYLYPYFKKDLEEGRLDMEGAAELLGEYIAHLGGQEKMVVAFRQQMDQGQHITNITIGGVTSEGKDASNELSYLILHAAGLGRYAEPHITLRWHAGTPRWLMLKAVETNQKIGGGIPQFMSDPHIIQYMLDRGVKREHALDYAIIGCVASCPGGNSDRGMYRVAAIINAALSVDLALHSGISPLTGNRIGPETGDPRTFSSFDQLLAAYKIQHKFIIQRSLWKARIAHKTQQELFRSILPSALMPRCLERGRTYQLVAYPQTEDEKTDKALYGNWEVIDRANIDVADSLMAVKRLVFDEKRLSLGELLEVLDSNWKGKRGEDIRQMCLRAPKYGNDIDEVDQLAGELGDFSASVIYSDRSPFGGSCTISRNGLAWHYWGGKGVGALPNGRKAGEPLYDGSLSPMRGMDSDGPTAVLRSALKTNFSEARQSVLNIRFPASLVQSRESAEKLIALTEGFLANGGSHIQYNLLDQKTLMAAKTHPEQYKDLVVRVGGYSAYFVLLTSEVQDEIIRRTEHGL